MNTIEFEKNVDIGKTLEDNWHDEMENIVKTVPGWKMHKFSDYYTDAKQRPSDAVQGDLILTYKDMPMCGIDCKLGKMISINSIFAFLGFTANNRRRACYAGLNYLINNSDEFKNYVMLQLYEVFKEHLPTLNNIPANQLGNFLKDLVVNSGFQMKTDMFGIMPKSNQIGIIVEKIPLKYFIYKGSGHAYLKAAYKNATIDYLSYKSVFWDKKKE